MKLKRWIGLTICLFLFAAPSPAGATECIPATPEQQVASAEVIVTAAVTAMDDGVMIRAGNTITMPEQGVPFTLKVDRVYKGEAGPDLTVHQRAILGAPNLQPGDRWLLFLHRDGFGNLTAGPCTPSTKLAAGTEPTPELAKALGSGRAPGGETGVGTGSYLTVWVAGAGAMGALLAGAGICLFWRRRRGR